MYAVMRVASSGKQGVPALLAADFEEWQIGGKINNLYEKYVFCA